MERGLFASLTFRIDRWASGASQGYMDDFNVTSLKTTKPDPDVKSRVSFKDGSRGQALGSVSLPKPDELEFTTDSLPPQLMAMALLGTAAPFAQTAATATAGTVAVTHLDTWIPLSHHSLTAFAAAGHAEGTDYEVHLAAGLFKAKTGGNITAGSTVDYTLSAPAASGHEIYAGTNSLIQVSMLGTGINMDTGKRCGIEIYRATISPSGGMSFISDDYISVSFKGTMIKPEDKAGPYRWWEID